MPAVAEELLFAADDEQATIDELTQRLPDVFGPVGEVSTVIPGNRPASFVRVLNVGGGDRDLVTTVPTQTIEAYASRESVARRLASVCKAILLAAGRAGELGGVTCYDATASVPANLPDPGVTDRFRYTFTLTAALRMQRIAPTA